MSVIDDLTANLYKNFDDFRNSYNKNKLSFPNVDDFQKKMIGKGYILFQTSDYLSSIIYFSLELWSYALTSVSGGEKEIQRDASIASIKKIIGDARQKLKSSLSSEGKEESIKFIPESEKDMIDKMTGKNISFDTMSGALREKQMIRNKFVYPNLYKHLFLSDSNNVLLFGPPGSGKTQLAKASIG